MYERVNSDDSKPLNRIYLKEKEEIIRIYPQAIQLLVGLNDPQQLSVKTTEGPV